MPVCARCRWLDHSPEAMPLPGSDVDLLVVVNEGAVLDVQRVIRGGCDVEQHRYTPAAATERFDRQPAHVYLLLDSIPVHDPEGFLEELVCAAVARERTYRMPTGEADLKRYWWPKVRSKLSCALERGDTLLAGFSRRPALLRSCQTCSHWRGVRRHPLEAPPSLGLQSCGRRKT